MADQPVTRRRLAFDRQHPHYRWVALSNTTLGVLMATINASIVIISLPAIFRGIELDPLAPGNVSYLLWMLMGYLVVTAVLVVTLGRLGDMYGRVKIYNAGFVVFTIGSIALALDPFKGQAGALWLIVWRVVQGIGASMLFANSTAILMDAFAANRRGMALGINQVAAIAGSFIGLILGGVLSAWDWRLVFFVSVPFGLIGTIWSYVSLQELGQRRPSRIDWWGNILFAVGLTALLAGITYGIQPYGGRSQGWTNPWVLAGLIGGTAMLVAFCIVESKVTDPMFSIRLFKIRAFWAGNLAGLLASMARGGLQFMLIIWLQGIWLPLHGYNFEDTPLWAGIYLLPLTVAFLLAGPLSGALSDRFGARAFATAGLVLVALSFLGMLRDSGGLRLLGVRNAVDSQWDRLGHVLGAEHDGDHEQRPAGRARRGVGDARHLLQRGLGVVHRGVLLVDDRRAGDHPAADDVPGVRPATACPRPIATHVAQAPPVGSLFAAFLGYNPVQTLLGPQVIGQLLASDQATLTGKEFFPQLISGPFHQGLVVVFAAAIIMSLIGAAASLVAGGKYVHQDVEQRTAEVASRG